MNNKLKFALRFPLYVIECTIVLLVCYQTFVLLMMIIPVGSSNTKGIGTEAFVITNGVHTDICIPVDLASDWLSFIDAEDYTTYGSDIKYLSFGWGDKGFYLNTPEWSDLKFSVAVEAMILNSPTTMHMVAHLKKPIVSDRIKSIKIYHDKLEPLKSFILSGFQQNENGPLLIENANYGPLDNFYEANGSYSLFETCNSWTNKALKAAGIRTSLDAFHEQGIMRHLN
jgi:uncharacterized protein (TIGR02117 family)